LISIIIAAILGIVQGFTEVFPISSSLHGYVVIELLNKLILTQVTDGKCLASLSGCIGIAGFTEISNVYKNGMDVVLHVGSLFAIMIFFRNDVVRMICEFLKFLKYIATSLVKSLVTFDAKSETNYQAKSQIKSQTTRQIKSEVIELIQPQTKMNFIHVIVFTLPICFVTLCIQFVFSEYSIYAGVLSIFSAIALYLVNKYAVSVSNLNFTNSEKKQAQQKQQAQGIQNPQNRDALTLRSCFMVGFIQSFAIFPGMSRFGLCLIGFRLLKFSLNHAVRYSLMFSMPIIFGSMIFKIKYILSISILEIATGVFFSFLFTSISLPLAVRLLSKNRFMIFLTLYRIVLGLGILCFM
jgi:undecaprenyl pyrophosphate phosphatase UppP